MEWLGKRKKKVFMKGYNVGLDWRGYGHLLYSPPTFFKKAYEKGVARGRFDCLHLTTSQIMDKLCEGVE